MDIVLKDHEDKTKIEVDLLLAGIREHYGYDFSHYSYASLKRRLERAKEHAKLTRFTELLDLLLHDETYFDEFLKIMSVTVTTMFRDPLFYRAVREQIIPVLRTFPFTKIWHAGCATGEEVYSMAAILHEEKLLERTRIYATDFNKHSLDIASKGIYPAKNVTTYAENYTASGGKEDFSKYYSNGYNLVKFNDYLKERITFSYHNLVTDGVFGEMNLVCCRNVLIYFDKTLQEHVLSLFNRSLCYGGFLCLGNKESLKFTAIKPEFDTIDSKQRIYKKCSPSYAHHSL